MMWFDRHRRFRDQLSVYIDGELDAPAAERLEAHLTECGRCRAEYEQIRDTVAALRDLPQVEAPRSFALTPEQVAVRRAPLPAASLAFGMRVAAAGVAVALAAVLMVDRGNFGGESVSRDAAAPQMLTEDKANEDEMAATGAAPAEEGMPAPDEPDSAEPGQDRVNGLDADETQEGDDAGAGFMTGADIADTPSDGSEDGELPAATAFPSSEELERAMPEESESRDGNGGIDALTAAEIGLAAALGLLVAGGLALAYAGRKR